MKSSRGRNRQDAVCGNDCPAAYSQGRRIISLQPQSLESDNRANDIHYGIDGAYLVEMDLFRRDAVHFALSLTEAAENSGTFFFHPFR